MTRPGGAVNESPEPVSEPRGPREVGVGLIGLGWMGRLHTKAYQAVPVTYPELGLRPVLAHVSDVTADRRESARDVLGYARASADFRAVLADPRVDVVSVCAPNAAHREIALAAAAAGTPFWIEKPAGRDAADTADIAAAAHAAGLVTAVGFNYRHAPAVARIRELVAGGELGRVTGVRCVFLNGQAADPRVALSWRFQREHAGNGVLGDLLCHVVDLVRHVVGPATGEITEVCAASAIVHPERPLVDTASGTHFDRVDGGPLGPVENEDHAVALARFAGGALGTLEVSRVAVGPQCQLLLEVSGTLGSATWDFERMNELRLARLAEPGWITVPAHAGLGEYARFQPGPGVAMGYDDLKVIEAAGFLAAATGRSAGPDTGVAPATVADAWAAAEVVHAVGEAAGQGGWTAVKGAVG
jgi:predicted dehydrogenase